MTGQDSSPDDLAILYRDTITRHAATPVGYRNTIAVTHRHEEYNSLCGDRIELQLQVNGTHIEAAAFDGEACAICMASASMLCSLAPGRTVEALLRLGEDLRKALDRPVGIEEDEKESRVKPLLQPLPRRPPHRIPQPLLHEELRALLGVRPYPSRIRCATLPWTAALRALCG